MTFALKHLTNAFTNQIIEESSVHETFQNHYEHDYKDRYQTEDICFNELLLFITLTFRQGLISIHPNGQAHPINEYKKFIFQVNRNLFGKDLANKRALQPKGFAWVDFEGSRVGQGSTGLKNPHIHSLLLVRPEFRLQY